VVKGWLWLTLEHWYFRIISLSLSLSLSLILFFKNVLYIYNVILVNKLLGCLELIDAMDRAGRANRAKIRIS
jgi:hypothetical protein